MWEFLRPAIEVSLPPLAYPASDIEMTRLLANLLAGRMECWLGVKYGANAREVVVYGVMVTEVKEDTGTSARCLWLYAIYGWRGVPPALVKTGFERLKTYARQRECKAIAGVTNVDQVIGITRQLGGDVTYTILRLEV